MLVPRAGTHYPEVYHDADQSLLFWVRTLYFLNSILPLDVLASSCPKWMTWNNTYLFSLRLQSPNPGGVGKATLLLEALGRIIVLPLLSLGVALPYLQTASLSVLNLVSFFFFFFFFECLGWYLGITRIIENDLTRIWTWSHSQSFFSQIQKHLHFSGIVSLYPPFVHYSWY